eukprot:5486091-Amphidinium_carterae.1
MILLASVFKREVSWAVLCPPPLNLVCVLVPQMPCLRLEAIAFLVLLLCTSHGCMLKGVDDEAQMDAQQLGVHVGFAAVSAAT